jgi:rhomboid protease GluP
MYEDFSTYINDRIPPSFVTLCLISAIALVYLGGMIVYPEQLLIQSREMILALGQNNELVIEGEIFRLFTALWLHLNVIHLSTNLLFLFIFGTRLEELKRGMIVALVFLGSGITGNLATLVLVFFEVNFISLGASGAIFGLLGALVYLLRGKSKAERRKMYYTIAIFFLFTISQETNFISHLFGFLGGFSLMKISESTIWKNLI